MQGRSLGSLTALVMVVALLAACGQPAPTATTTTSSAGQTPATGATAAPASAAAPAKPTANAAGQSSGGNLKVTLGDLGAESFDVIIPQVNNVTILIYEPLLRYDEQGNLVPWLAESYSMSPDGKLWTFNLRKGVK